MEMYQTQNILFSDQEENKVVLNFNHLAYFLIANRKLTNIKLTLGDDVFPLKQGEDDIIKLTNTLDSDDVSNYCINFSQVDIQQLEYECDDSEGLIISCVNSHNLRKMSGMIGLTYSK